MRYYYMRIDRNNNPIPFSNFVSKKLLNKKGTVRFLSQAELCCDPEADNPNPEVVSKKKYYVRLDEHNRPVNNSLVVGRNSGHYRGYMQVYSVSCCIADPIVLGTPVVTVAADGLDFILNWVNIRDNSGYEVQYSGASDFSGAVTIATLPTNTVTYTDTPPAGLAPHYRVRAIGDGTIYATSAWGVATS